MDNQMKVFDPLPLTKEGSDIVLQKYDGIYYYTKDFKNEIFRIETKYRKAVHHQFFIRVMIFNKRIILIVQFS